MKKYLILLVFITFLTYPVSAIAFTAPPAPESAEQYMPDSQETFAEGLWSILKSAIIAIRPEIGNAFSVCLSLIATVLLISILNDLTEHKGKQLSYDSKFHCSISSFFIDLTAFP